MANSLAIFGETGCGKTSCVMAMINGELVLLIDPEKKSLAWEAFKKMLEDGQPVVFDSLDNNGLVIPLEWQTDKQREMIAELLIGRRGMSNMDATPLLEHTLDMFLRVLPPLWPIEKGIAMLYQQHLLDEAISLCRDAEAAAWWDQLPPSMSARERIIAPLIRIVSILQGSHIKKRVTANGPDLIAQLAEGRSVILEGGHAITQKEQRLFFRLVIKTVLEWKRRTESPDITIVIEEAQSHDLIGPQEAAMFQTCRKYGIQFIVVGQEPHFTDENVTRAVMNNSGKVWMRCGEECAEIAARDLVVMHSPYAVKEVYERPFGSEEDMIERRHIHFTNPEQHAFIKQHIMQQAVGEGIMSINGRARKIKVPLERTNVSDEQALEEYQEWQLRTMPQYGFKEELTKVPSNGQGEETNESLTSQTPPQPPSGTSWSWKYSSPGPLELDDLFGSDDQIDGNGG